LADKPWLKPTSEQVVHRREPIIVAMLFLSLMPYGYNYNDSLNFVKLIWIVTWA